jgi:hypothetical protein
MNPARKNPDQQVFHQHYALACRKSGLRLPEGSAGYQSTPCLGQSGPLTGLQLLVRVNCKQGLMG